MKSSDDNRILLLRLGELICNYHAYRHPDPFEQKPKVDNPALLLPRIHDATFKLRATAAVHIEFEPLRKCLGIALKDFPSEAFTWIIALVGYHDYASSLSEQTADSITCQIAPLIEKDGDTLRAKLIVRRHMAALLEREVLFLSDKRIHLCFPLRNWLSGDNALCIPGLNESFVRQHINRKKALEAERAKTKQPAPASIASPQDLFIRLRQIVVGQDDACRVLATRGWLHLKRAEMLRAGQQVGQNECLLFISQQSGVGKTYLAENYGRICALPFHSSSATDFTSIGFVGLDLVEDSIKALLKTIGNPHEAATIQRAQHGGVLFYDEWTKKRKQNTNGFMDVSGLGPQQEILRVMEGCRVQIGNRRAEREPSVEINTTGMMFIFAGFVENFDKIIAKLNKRGDIGFGGFGADASKVRDAYLFDAMVDYGLIPEFLNRLSKIVMFRKLTEQDMEAIAISPSGVIANYNRLLTPLGLTIKLNPGAIRCMAGVCVETGMMARGLRLIVGALVEDAVFNQIKNEVRFGVKEVKAAIGKVVSGG